jgi:hypothetical protein
VLDSQQAGDRLLSTANFAKIGLCVEKLIDNGMDYIGSPSAAGLNDQQERRHYCFGYAPE